MSDVESIIISDQYMIMVGVTLFFTVLALTRRSVTLTALTSICWLICGATHIVASPTTSPMLGLAFLYFGVGIIFLVMVFVQLFDAFTDMKKRKWEGPP